MSEAMSVFQQLSALNVNGHTEKKKTGSTELTYLSWPWAWAEVKKRFPDASYTVVKNQNGIPYFDDPRTGIMVYTNVTIDGITHEMWLPVMDGANRAMRFEPYEIKTKYGANQVNAATMFDVNKTIMRCLVKNLAMFGLGLYIFAGEDLPETEGDQKPEERPEDEVPETVKTEPFSAEETIKKFCKKHGISVAQYGQYRNGLIAANQVADIPASGMTLEQVSDLNEKIYTNYLKEAEKHE